MNDRRWIPPVAVAVVALIAVAVVIAVVIGGVLGGDPGDGGGADGGNVTRDDSGGPASAVIRTTTTTSTTNPPAGASPASTTAATTTATTGPTTTSTVTAPGTTEQGTPPVPTLAPRPAPPPTVGDPVVASVAVGEFDQPVDLAVRPGDDALWVVEQTGRVVRVDGENSTVVLDLSDRLTSGGERGLLGLVFHPDGSRAYTNFTTADDTVIAEYAVAADGTIDRTSERVVLQVAQPFDNHNAGDLEFGPDGMLFVPLGDGGSGGDPQRNGSNPETLLGSILRIDPTPSGDRGYTIPDDNPFAGGAEFAGVTGAPEVWAWGLRNPWKITFDPVTADLWIPDVGQNQFEEINLASPVDDTVAGRGLDFGWSAFEGTQRFDGDVADSGRTIPPVLTYDHGDGCSISGGVPYRGTDIPELAPAFVYSDYCAGTIWALDLAGARNLTLLDGFADVAAVRAGPGQELYVLERGGTVHRLVAG